MNTAPVIEYEPAPCPRCGARTVNEASNRCQPMRDETGEGTCPAEHEDEAGKLLQPTAESIKALDRWCESSGW